MPTVRVKMNDEEFKKAMDLLDIWSQDHVYHGLIEITETPEDERQKDIEITLLQVSDGITFDIWKKFCEEIGMNIPFPVT